MITDNVVEVMFVNIGFVWDTSWIALCTASKSMQMQFTNLFIFIILHY